MAEAKQAPKADPQTKIEELHRNFAVDMSKFEVKADEKNEETTKLFQLNFIDQRIESKGQIYSKIFTNKDINEIKKAIKFDGIQNTKLQQIILYSLSKKNKKYVVNYSITKTDKENFIEFTINYDTEFFAIKIDLIIPAKLTDFDALKKELKRVTTKLNDAVTLVTTSGNEIRVLKQKIQNLQVISKKQTKEINDFKNEFTNIIRDEINDAFQKIGNKVSYSTPIVFTEGYKETFQRQEGWNIIAMNYADRIDDDIYLNDNGDIILNEGKYIVEGFSFIDGSHNTTMQFVSKDGELNIPGFVCYSHYNIPWHNVSSTTIYLPKQTIDIEQTTEFETKIYNENGAHGYVYFDDLLKDKMGYCYSTSITIQKIS